MSAIKYFLMTSLLFTSQAFAQQEIQFVGSHAQPLPSSTYDTLTRLQSQNLPTSVTLLNVQLTENAWNKLRARTQDMESKQLNRNAAPAFTTKNMQLGMGNVPVLDQGAHGTCVTFANTAAIDAALNQGDNISQLCQLQLGRYLEKNGYGVSGWNGSMSPSVLHQMQTFGVVNKTMQRNIGCGGLTDYPTSNALEPESEISLNDYHAISEVLPKNQVAWTSLLDAYQVFLDRTDSNKTLLVTKAALDAGDRLTFGVLLFAIDQGVAGAVGKYKASNDSWVLTPEIIKIIKDGKSQPGGHAMIITGYNDDAIAIDKQGRSHQGLLTLRNSWGDRIGDQGNFYMSYDYFRNLTIEVTRIRSTR
ncbi:MAG: hypothetical protein A3F46_01985 [Legionellales bacterium RIFCSPHIGHO2_12_FULL_42_9]|nr:MAG: hypothetical protein A3F46_01985 [Legionellales bacterium RIFCSPHIGHO2_12_FULL_42_9]